VRTCLDCIPCFFKQALEAARIAGADDATQRRILNEVARVLPDFRLEASPPEMARIIYRIVRDVTGVEDPYRNIKERSNRYALGIYDELIRIRDQGKDRMRTAVELAIAGNIIDYGVKNTLDVRREIEKILSEENRIIRHEESRFFQLENFREALSRAQTILYLGDNAGETVFDRVLLEEILRQYPEKEMIFAVKDQPAINDALMKDALDCGIQTVARVVSSGSDAPGTLLPLCSESFQKIFRNADMVISKGQGNFETLSGVERPVFFLLLAKCPVIANHIGCRVGDVILWYHTIEEEHEE